ncbi:hypothetical protein ACMFMF_003877 [Clarireedia jacksonii]
MPLKQLTKSMIVFGNLCIARNFVAEPELANSYEFVKKATVMMPRESSKHLVQALRGTYILQRLHSMSSMEAGTGTAKEIHTRQQTFMRVVAKPYRLDGL